jgi:hypothetical protein
MHPTGFGPAIPAGERLQTHALGRMATGIDEFLWLGWPCLYFRRVLTSKAVTVHFKISHSALNLVSYLYVSWFKERKIFTELCEGTWVISEVPLTVCFLFKNEFILRKNIYRPSM